MKKHQLYRKLGLGAILATVVSICQVHAADLATASGTLAEVSVLAVQAKADLASAAISGDVNAIADAVKRADAVDAAVADAQAAYSALERALASGDLDAAAAAAEDLAAAKQKADDALNGAVPEPTPKSAKEVWKEGQTNTGGGPGRAYDPPNIYDVPWQTAGLRSMYSSMFSTVFTASGGSSANSNSYGDSDATPE